MSERTLRGSLRTAAVLAVAIGSLFIAPTNCLAVGEAGAQFLKIGIGAKAGAMGDAFVALADDPSAIYWNPAGLTNAQTPQVQATYGIWFEDMGHHSFCAVYPAGWGWIGGLLCYSPSGDLPLVSEDLEQSGEYDASDLCGVVSYAWKMGDNASYGCAMKIVQCSIEEESASAFAVDAGFIYRVPQFTGLSIGGSIQNVGTELKFIQDGDPLPVTLRGGLAFRKSDFVATLDVSSPRDNDASLHVGAEYTLLRTLALRAGFMTRPEMESATTFGLGVTWRQFEVSYAYMPFEELESTHRISADVVF